ncbi:HlyD family efflux transporter periplasmic adaptor subunit [Paractinoplanes atraurantiacus]|uniref:HlyD family secretion protein n=1 Tax=Paractinoplanes atraurantiacus TaxID=1036182 RepID=A0A285IU39_9ACTN|nr:HlyD family secretion protein [Actinoplanes atraurantiacus]SNY51343.1 HlyD family secretion protein [Actinoplanes atraurantiacus]
MSATVDNVRTFDDETTRVIERTAPADPPPKRRGRGALRVARTSVVVVILLGAAGAGGTHVVRQRLAERNMVDAGTAVLIAQPIAVGSADAAVVTDMRATERTSVTAGAVLATITLTADGDGTKRRVQKLQAPTAGIVTKINVAPGQIARAGEPIVTLYDPAKVAFAVDVPLEKLRKFRLGMTAYVTGPGLSRRITATLEKVEPKVDAGRPANAADQLTVVLRPDPAARSTVRTLVPGLQFAVVVDTTTAAGSTPAVNSA